MIVVVVLNTISFADYGDRSSYLPLDMGGLPEPNVLVRLPATGAGTNIYYSTM